MIFSCISCYERWLKHPRDTINSIIGSIRKPDGKAAQRAMVWVEITEPLVYEFHQVREVQQLRQHEKEVVMADNPVYAVVNLVMTDAATYRKYEKGFFPLLKKW